MQYVLFGYSNLLGHPGRLRQLWSLDLNSCSFLTSISAFGWCIMLLRCIGESRPGILHEAALYRAAVTLCHVAEPESGGLFRSERRRYFQRFCTGNRLGTREETAGSPSTCCTRPQWLAEPSFVLDLAGFTACLCSGATRCALGCATAGQVHVEALELLQEQRLFAPQLCVALVQLLCARVRHQRCSNRRLVELCFDAADGLHQCRHLIGHRRGGCRVLKPPQLSGADGRASAFWRRGGRAEGAMRFVVRRCQVPHRACHRERPR
eukprot:315100-Chlamydomonas_euryale.AAC.2